MVAERHLGPVPDRTANADGGHRHRADQLRSVPCGHRDGVVLACTGQGAAAERTADGTDSGRTDRSFAGELRTRWGDSRDVAGRRGDIRGSRNVAMAFPGGAACAVACDGLAEAEDVLAVDGAAAERSRWGEDRGHLGHRAAVELAADRPMLGQVLVLRLMMGWKLVALTRVEGDQPGGHELVEEELELPPEPVPVDVLVFVRQRPEVLVLAGQQQHGTVLAELVQLVGLEELAPVQLACSQLVSPCRAPPIS